MRIITLVDEDFVNYKLPSMFILFPKCTLKCGNACQNKSLLCNPGISISEHDIVQRYINNPITKAIVFGGLDPFDTPDDCLQLARVLRQYTLDTIVIYTGYDEPEINQQAWFQELVHLGNIIIKFGRFIEGQEPHFDAMLGINLASNNQYARKYENIN